MHKKVIPRSREFSIMCVPILDQDKSHFFKYVILFSSETYQVLYARTVECAVGTPANLRHRGSLVEIDGADGTSTESHLWLQIPSEDVYYLRLYDVRGSRFPKLATWESWGIDADPEGTSRCRSPGTSWLAHSKRSWEYETLYGRV